MDESILSKYDETLFTPGHRACPGYGASIAVRAILEATGPDVIVVSPTGCVETFTAQYPYSPWGVPWLHVLFENAAAVASGVEAALKKRGLADKAKVIVIGGDGGQVLLGLFLSPRLLARRAGHSGRAQRGGAGTLHTRVQIGFVVVADIGHVVAALHHARERA